MKHFIYAAVVWFALFGNLQAEDAPSFVELKEYKGFMRRFAFCDEGKKFITSGDDQTLRIWEVETGRELHKLEGRLFQFYLHLNIVVTQSGDGRDGTFHIWDTESGKELLKVPVWDWGMFGLSPDGKNVVIGRYVPSNPALGIEWRFEREIWNVESGKRWLHLDGGNHHFLPDGKKVATVSKGNGVQIWDTESGKELIKITGGFANVHPVSVNFSPDGKKMATREGVVMNSIWEIETGEELYQLEGIFYGFTRDGKKIVTTRRHEHDAAPYSTTHIWDAESGKELLAFEGTFAHFSPDEKKIVTSKGSNISIWDVESKEELHKLEGRHWDTRFSPDGKKFFAISVHGNGETIMLDVESGKRFLLRGRFCRLSNDGKNVITYMDDFADDWSSPIKFIFDVETGKELKWNGVFHTFSPDGKIISHSVDNAHTNWENQNWTTHIGDTEAEYGLKLEGYFGGYSPDKKRIATSSKEETHIYDAETGKILHQLEGRLFRAFSPDGKKVVTTDREGITRIWTLE